ncbi:MAG: leucine-rich repeat domain-containing protein [Paludibacter sp.]
MKKTHLYILLNLIFLGVYGQTKTVNVTTAGTLSTLITSAETSTITTLTVSGKIDARDVAYLRDKITSLAVLNLSAASIQAYTGIDGTYSGVTLTYPANELPLCAFYNANTVTYKTTLTSITLPTTLKSIGGSAFYYCYALSGTFSIPAGVISIGSYALYGCSGLSAFSVDAANARYSSTNGILYNKNQDSLFICPGSKSGSISIPSTVTYIGPSSFDYCYNLTGTLTLPASLKTIGAYAFYYCTGLTGNISLPSTIKTIDDGAFYGCTGLTGVITIPNVTSYIGLYAFFDCKGISSYQVDAGNTKYSSSNDALYSKNADSLIVCAGTKSGTFTIPSTVKVIKTCAFYDCSLLSGTLNIPASVKSIGTYAFYGCTGVSAFNVEAGNISYSSITGVLLNKAQDSLFICPSAIAGSYTVPPTVKSIGTYAFYYCKSLSGSINIPASVTSIGDYAFYGCSSLTAFNVSSGNNRYFSTNGVLYNLAQDSLLICPLGKTGAFSIPGTVKTVDYYAFDGCSGLTSITIPSSVTTIGTYAFEYCTGLTEIKIPKNVTSIGSGAFYNCTSLTKVMNVGIIPQTIDSYTFGLVNKTTCQLIIPVGTSTLYKAAAYWQDFTTINETNFDTPVKSPLAGRIKIYTQNLKITLLGLDENETVTIYNIAGTLLYRQVSRGSLLTIPISSHGCYIVNTTQGTSVLSL